MYVTGYASNAYELLDAMNNLLLSVGWKVLKSTQTTYSGKNVIDYLVWQGKGDGNDNIYLQAKIYEDDIKSIAIDSMAGYDEELDYFEQPGSIQSWLKADGEDKVDQPAMSLVQDELFYYWLFADTYRMIGVARLSIQYESFYMGFINPISAERQYPYPMYVAGNTSLKGAKWPDNESGSFVFPYKNSGFLRRADGTWRAFDAKPTEPDPYSQGSVFPYTAHNKQLIPNYKGKSESSIIQDNFLLIPALLQTTNPVDMSGLLRDVYWISGTRDLASEQTFEDVEKNTHICFDTKQLRDSNSYFSILMR